MKSDLSKNQEKLAKNLKKQFDDVDINQIEITTIKMAIQKAKKARRIRKITRIVSLSTVATFIVLFILPTISPQIAEAMDKIPIIRYFINIDSTEKRISKNIEVNQPTIDIKEKDEATNKVIKDFNVEIDTYIKGLIKDFKAQHSDIDHANLSVDYSVIKDTNNMFSVKIEGCETAASGYMFSKIYHINKVTGKIISLKDIFKSGVNYTKIVNKEINSEIKKENKENTYFFEGIKDDQNFYFDNKFNLVICFDEYEIASGSEGELEFTINRNKIEKYLKE